MIVYFFVCFRFADPLKNLQLAFFHAMMIHGYIYTVHLRLYPKFDFQLFRLLDINSDR